jgi:hypothetical protein
MPMKSTDFTAGSRAAAGPTRLSKLRAASAARGTLRVMCSPPQVGMDRGDDHAFRVNGLARGLLVRAEDPLLTGGQAPATVRAAWP